MKQNMATIDNSVIRKSLVIVGAPLFLIAFVLIMLWTLLTKIWETLTNWLSDIGEYTGQLATAIHYSWVGKEEYDRRRKA